MTNLPDTLRGLVAARLDALSSDERAVVQDAAVLGRREPVEGAPARWRTRSAATSTSVAPSPSWSTKRSS